MGSVFCFIDPYVCSYVNTTLLSFFNFYLSIYYFWLCWMYVAACRPSLVAVSRDYSSLQCTAFSLQWLLIAEHRVQMCRHQQLWYMCLVAPSHVGSSQTRNQTHVPCIGRWILNHSPTREIPIPHCFDCCNFVVLSEVWEGYASYFVLFLQDSIGNFVSFMVPYKFQDYLFQFCEKCHG